MDNKNNHSAVSDTDERLEAEIPADDTTSSIDELKQKIVDLTAQRSEWQAKAEDNWDRYLRARSEMENFRKRTERDIHNRINRGKSDLILSLLDVMDNFDRFLSAGEKNMQSAQDSGFQAFFDGARLIKRQILDLLMKEGVEAIENPVGKTFDPALHEALFAQEGGGEHGTIIEEIQKGYTYKGQILRPSRVKVIK